MNRTVSAAIEVQRYLKGIRYPASKSDLIKQAKQNNADKEVISKLEELNEFIYRGPAEVGRSIED